MSVQFFDMKAFNEGSRDSVHCVYMVMEPAHHRIGEVMIEVFYISCVFQCSSSFCISMITRLCSPLWQS